MPNLCYQHHIVKTKDFAKFQIKAKYTLLRTEGCIFIYNNNVYFIIEI